MAGQQEEFERRLLARVRSGLRRFDEDFPHGWEIGQFVVTFEYFEAPNPDEDLDAWESGPYAGWYPNGMTLGSSPSYWVDRRLLEDALDFVQRELATDHDEESE